MEITHADEKYINDIVLIHLQAFPNFFLTFLGPKFLYILYGGYIEHIDSELLAATDQHGKVVGFVAYSRNQSGLYKHLLSRHFLAFAWYGFCGFLRKPKAFFRILRALKQPKISIRDEKYIELSSIGVEPGLAKQGIGSALVDAVKQRIDFSEFEYIMLETDAKDNDSVNKFYQRNGFFLHHVYTTREGREMNEYRFMPNFAETDSI